MEKISRSRTLNPEKIEIAEEKYKTGTGNMERRKSLPAVSLPALKRLQQQYPAQGIGNFLCFIDSYSKVSNSFHGITKRSSKQTDKCLVYNLKVLFKKRKRLLSRLQRKSENINTLIQSKLNVRKVNEEFNQYDDLLRLFLDAQYQYLEDSQGIEDGNWLDEVDQNIFTFRYLLHNYLQNNEENRSRKSSKSSKSKKSSVSSGSRSAGSSTSMKEKAIKEKMRLTDVMTEAS